MIRADRPGTSDILLRWQAEHPIITAFVSVPHVQVLSFKDRRAYVCLDLRTFIPAPSLRPIRRRSSSSRSPPTFLSSHSFPPLTPSSRRRRQSVFSAGQTTTYFRMSSYRLARTGPSPRCSPLRTSTARRLFASTSCTRSFKNTSLSTQLGGKSTRPWQPHR